MEASILSIGDEILLGQIMNTNAAWMSSLLTSNGIRVRHHHVIGDQIESIQRALDFCLQDSEVVLVTGGLGPTHDDITVEAISKYLNSELVLDEDWVLKMSAFFKSRGREMTANNKKQALRPKNSVRIDNEWGTAPGLWIEHNEKTIICTPGVPYEMEAMLTGFVLPRLLQKIPSTSTKTFTRNIFTTGIGESLLASKVDGLTPKLGSFLGPDFELAWLPSLAGVKLRMTARAVSLDAAELKFSEFEKYIEPVLKEYIFGKNAKINIEVKLEEVVGSLLKQKKKTIAVAESCTGGLVTSRLTDIAGSSSYVVGTVVSYSNEIKVSELGVSEEILQSEGAVSEAVARAMAEGIRKNFGASIGLSVTGIAGPDGGTLEKPVGTVWIALADETITIAKKFMFEKDRLRNKFRSSQAALDMVRRRLMM